MLPESARSPIDALAQARMKFKHVIVIVQENRTIDNLFQGYNKKYGADVDVQSYGLNSANQKVPLTPVPFEAPFDNIHAHDLPHGHPGGFVTEFNNGKMNGWDQEAHRCAEQSQGWFGPCPVPHETAYGYVPAYELTQYWELAHNFILADHVRQMNEGPSFIAHQYLIAGQSGGFTSGIAEADQPLPVTEKTSGCNVAGAYLRTIRMNTAYPGKPGPLVFPCEIYRPYLTILEDMDQTYPGDPNDWGFDVPGTAFISATWTAPWGVQTIYRDPLQTKKIHQPDTSIFKQLAAHTLPKLTYVTPCFTNSDHATSLNASGPRWVASIVNAVGRSSYWKDTAVLVTWDDWGGWYDHYPPVHPSFNPNDPYEYGFRVPFLVISAYDRQQGLVDHTVRTQASILSFTEWVFGLPSLKTLDQYSDNLSTLFDFSRTPIQYQPVDTHNFDVTNCASNSALENAFVDD